MMWESTLDAVLLWKSAFPVLEALDFVWALHGVTAMGLFGLCGHTLRLRAQLRRQQQQVHTRQRRINQLVCRLRNLRQAHRIVLRASEAKSAFLSHTCHDIRTPLAALVGLLALERRNHRDAQQRQRNLTAAWRMSCTLLDLLGKQLDLAKIESGAHLSPPQPIVLSNVLHDVDALFRPAAQAKGLALSVTLRVHHTCVLFNPTALKQILCNLLSNAIKFTARGAITVTLQQSDSQQSRYTLCVSDSGPGLTPEQQQRMFDPFVQFHTSHTQARGSGLGLAICQRLAEQLDCDLQVESTPQQGCTFTLHFTAPPAVAVAAHPPIAASAIPAPALRLLVVDDNAIQRQLLSQQLMQAGHQVLLAENARTALALWRQYQPDCILTDCRMPEIDGVRFARLLRAEEQQRQWPRALLFGLTANAETQERQRALAAGMDDCLVKPLALADFLPRVNAALAARQEATLHTLNLFTAHNTAALHTLLALARKQNAHDFKRLQQAVTRNDFAVARHAAHQLKGSALILRASRLQQSCLAAEQAAECGDAQQLQRVMPAVTAALAELEHLFQQLNGTASPFTNEITS